MLIEGTLDSTANALVLMEFFASAHCGAAGRGEADTGLGSREVNTDGGGHASFALTSPASLAAGQLVTATMTDPSGNTSELSACVPVVMVPSDIPFAGLRVMLDMNDRR